MAAKGAAAVEYESLSEAYLSGSGVDSTLFGPRLWPQLREVADTNEEGVEIGGRSIELCQEVKEAINSGLYILDAITCISLVGDYETYDLTIDRCHSFVANGMVVHNTIPKKTKWAKKIRACFPAPPGYRFFQRDFSQGELRVVACVADETNMISAYKNGMDLHCLTASGFSGRSYEEFLALEKMDSDLYEELRRGAKAGNFGLLYGMGAEGFMEYARINYGVHLTLAEATKRRDAFFALYPGLLAYHDSSKNFVRHHQYVRSPLGRIRHLPLVKSKDSFVRSGAERQAINSPIQATLSDMALWSIAIIDQQRPDIQIVGMTHDSIYGYVHEDTWEEDLNQMGDVMSNLPFESVFGWKPQLSFPSDAEIGSTMADLKKYKKVA